MRTPFTCQTGNHPGTRLVTYMFSVQYIKPTNTVATEVSYTEARANFASLWDQAIDNREAIIVRRRGKESLALIPVDELAGILETAHLLRSPANAERLHAALEEVRRNESVPMTLQELGNESGLGQK